MNTLNVIVKIAASIAALAGSAFVVYMIPSIIKLLKKILSDDELKQLETIINAFVISAEQTMDVPGDEKKAYVEKQLEELGVEITDLVKALIEKAVVNEVNYGFSTEKDIDEEFSFEFDPKD